MNKPEDFRPCAARYCVEGEHFCTHPYSGYTKKPVTPDICKKCRVVTGLVRDLPRPPVLERIKSVGKAVVDVVRHPSPASQEEQDRRASICNACEFKSGNWCAACGCNLAAKQKMQAWRCNLGFWDQKPTDPT